MNPLLVPKEKLDNLIVDIEEEIERLMGEYGDIVLKTSYLYMRDIKRAEDAVDAKVINGIEEETLFKETCLLININIYTFIL